MSSSTSSLLASDKDDYDNIIAECKSLGLFQETPLIRSIPMSELVGKDVYIKLDCLQSSGSFKDRGMAYLCYSYLKQSQKEEGDSQKQSLKFVGSSGGNAGLALTTIAALKLKLDVSVIVPKTTKEIVIDKLKSLGANVTVHGAIWNEADTLARKIVAEDSSAVYVSPYDHPCLWTGHSTMMDEIHQQLSPQNIGTMITGVGGGGLLCGILEGLNRLDCQSTHVIACETQGTNKFALSMEQNKLVRLDGVNSIATSLGALEVTKELLDRSQAYTGGTISTSVCTDAEAVNACLQFSKDHRLLVEPACGAALAVVYSKRLREEFLSSTKSNNNDPIVVEVCGGSGVNIELLQQWKNDFL